jgi:hypothetical protein
MLNGNDLWEDEVGSSGYEYCIGCCVRFVLHHRLSSSGCQYPGTTAPS